MRITTKASKPAALIDVVSFGADPTGATDSAAAIAAALQHARSLGVPVVIDFPTGEYQVWPEQAESRELYLSNTVGSDAQHRIKTFGILVEAMSDVSIVGNGSRLVFHGLQAIFGIIDSRRVSISGFETDFAVPSVVDAVVDEVGSGYRLLRVESSRPYRLEGTSVVWLGETSPLTGEPYWQARDAMRYTQSFTPATGITRRCHNDLFADVRSLSDLGDGLIRVDYNAGVTPTDVGVSYHMREITRDQPGALVMDSSEITISDVHIGYLHGFGMLGQASRNLTLERVTFAPPVEAHVRQTAGFADFVHLSGMSGSILVQDCVFDGAHDDAINIHGVYLKVLEVLDGHSVRLGFGHRETAGFPVFAAGDEVEVVDVATQLPAAHLTVTAVDGPTGRDHANDLETMVLAFAEPVPDALREPARSFAVENLTTTPDVTIINNVFRHIPTRGILVTTRRPVLIEGNRFERMTMASVLIEGDAQYWFESGPVKDVTIRGNTFVEPGFPAIQVGPRKTTTLSATAVHSGVRIEQNTFLVDDATIVAAASVAGLSVIGNTIERSGRPGTSSSGPLVSASECSDVVVVDNIEIDASAVSAESRSG